MSETNGNSNGNGHKPLDVVLSHGNQCSAKSKQSQERCKRRCTPDRNVCVMHGGKTPSGLAHKGYQHGRYSKHLPAGIRDRYAAHLLDPTLTHLRPEIALVAGQLEEKLERLYAGESLKFWERAIKLLADYRKALDKQAVDPYTFDKPETRLDLLETLLQDGQASFSIFEEIQPMIEQYRKLTETETKRIAAMNQTFTAEQAMMFVRSLGDSIKRHVTDPKQLQAISEDFARLTA